MDISYYPNPIIEKLTVDLSNVDTSIINCFYTIADVSGKVISQKEILFYDSKLQIDFSQIPTGIYILSLKTDNELY